MTVSDRFLAVPINIADVPADGEVLINRYWSATDNGILFWVRYKNYKRFDADHLSPQCNHDEKTAAYLTKKLHDTTVRCVFVPIVYLTSCYRYLREHQ